MVGLSLLLELINTRKTRVLQVAEAALSESQYRAFRHIVLDEFGKSGLERELMQLFREDGSKDRHG